MLLAFTLTFRISLACELRHCSLGPHSWGSKQKLLRVSIALLFLGVGKSRKKPNREKSLSVDSVSRVVSADFLFVCSKPQALGLGNGWGPVIWKSNTEKQLRKQSRKQSPGLDDSSISLESGVLAGSFKFQSNAALRQHCCNFPSNSVLGNLGNKETLEPTRSSNAVTTKS